MKTYQVRVVRSQSLTFVIDARSAEAAKQEAIEMCDDIGTENSEFEVTLIDSEGNNVV